MSTTEQIELARQVDDLRAEGAELAELMSSLPAEDWQRSTSFKNWTIYDVIAHLHFSDHMGMTTIESGAAFQALMADMQGSGLPFVEYTRQWLGDVSGPELLDRWRTLLDELCDRLQALDPQERLTWAGPGMKPRMFTTARQMETWAHGWEIYDCLRLNRAHSDRIKNIAAIGVRTFGWTFVNRGLELPGDPPFVRLTAPSGDVWEWNDPGADSSVTGSAVEFCQVVTQVRNIADTQLEVRGKPAREWMAIAQCFAGGPEEPPAPGTRRPAN
ncbi:MAG: TIGR03084 family protein [Pseudomonadales bacterium]|nr:TIGR03084 family protein [Pseudomonadales bacterium]NIX07939.1 TIGR03084 family protein [Pseudomonadales bacterium]